MHGRYPLLQEAQCPAETLFGAKEEGREFRVGEDVELTATRTLLSFMLVNFGLTSLMVHSIFVVFLIVFNVSWVYLTKPKKGETTHEAEQ